MIGILQTSDYDCFDQVSPFLESFIDIVYKSMDFSKVTTVFTEYAELIWIINREDTVPHYNIDELKAQEKYGFSNKIKRKHLKNTKHLKRVRKSGIF